MLQNQIQLLLLNHSKDTTRKYIHVLEKMVLPEFVDVVVCEIITKIDWRNHGQVKKLLETVQPIAKILTKHILERDLMDSIESTQYSLVILLAALLCSDILRS